MCCFSSGWFEMKIMCRRWATCSPIDCFVSQHYKIHRIGLVYYKSNIIVMSLKYNFYITSRLDIAGNLHTWHKATITHSQTPNNPQPEQVQSQILSNRHSLMKLQLFAIFYQEHKTYRFVLRDWSLSISRGSAKRQGGHDKIGN